MDQEKFKEWVEKVGHESLKEHLEHASFLLVQANHLLLILLAGVGSGTGLCLTLFSKQGWDPLSAAIMAGTVWLAVVAMLLTKNCIATKETWPLYTEPCILIGALETLTPDQIKEAELNNIQERINLNRNRNSIVAGWLDRCRYMTAATPLVSAIFAAVVMVVALFGLS